MQDFKLEYTESDVVYDTVDTIKDREPQYLYYEIQVSRKQIAYVNVRVAAGEPIDWKNVHDIAEAAVEKNVRSYDWEDEYPQDIEVEHFKQVSEDEATEYNVYEA
jgi:hypothetical protein